jgi:RNA 2',3'-cyclic 3'-phosphodiesterase
MRLFFALWPDADAAGQLASVASKLTLKSPARLVTAGNYHVTLAFLGEVASLQLEKWRQIGRAFSAPRCTISFHSLEYWPDPKAVVAVALEPPAALLELWTQLRDAADLPVLSLRAHVTLARKVAQAPVLQAMSAITWHANSVSLVRSDTGGAESAYTVVDTWPLLYEP